MTQQVTREGALILAEGGGAPLNLKGCISNGNTFVLLRYALTSTFCSYIKLGSIVFCSF